VTEKISFIIRLKLKSLHKHVGSEVFTAVIVKNVVFWDVAPRRS
jgi:hypothetical protein